MQSMDACRMIVIAEPSYFTSWYDNPTQKTVYEFTAQRSNETLPVVATTNTVTFSGILQMGFSPNRGLMGKGRNFCYVV